MSAEQLDKADEVRTGVNRYFVFLVADEETCTVGKESTTKTIRGWNNLAEARNSSVVSDDSRASWKEVKLVIAYANLIWDRSQVVLIMRDLACVVGGTQHKLSWMHVIYVDRVDRIIQVSRRLQSKIEEMCDSTD